MKIFEYQTIVSGTGYNFKGYVDFVYNNYAAGPIIKQYMCDMYIGDGTTLRRIVPSGNTTRLKFAIVFCGHSGASAIGRSAMFVSYLYEIGVNYSGLAIHIYDAAPYNGNYNPNAAIGVNADVALALDSGFVVNDQANLNGVFYYYMVYW